MKTKLDYYRIFYETALHSSFSTAAQELFISQSAISQCIRQLETDLEAQLFTRSRRGVTLTKEGAILFQKIEGAMQSIEQGETLLARLHHLESGSLVIAAGDTITVNFLLPYLEKFHEKYPAVRIEMANSYSQHMIQFVKEGKAEIAFINLPVNDDELCITPCLEAHDVFVCGPDYNTKPRYSWREISQQPLILLEKNSNSRAYIQKEFKKKGIDLKPQIEVAVHELLIRFASIRLGVSCVVEEFSRESIESGKVKVMNVEPPLPARSIGYAYLKDTPLSLAAQAFIQLINEK